LEKVVEDLFSDLTPPKDAYVEVVGDTLHVTKWNWDYEDCEKFQLAANEFVRKNKKLKVYIFCNHPHVFTLGRGNERGDDSLVDFDTSLSNRLKYPVQKIHRGGGITFHYPGQWIFYPIVAITPAYSLDDHMCWILKKVAAVLREDLKIENVMTAKKLMGVWKDRKKLASIGVGVKRFVTLHGLALNLVRDEEMFNELKMINPCGMDHQTYVSVDQFFDGQDLLANFHKSFLSKLASETTDICSTSS
tara:strand:+ start:63522 stop:64262 length:741 start_codon:yes stop_codon:yes gene_type:complete